MELTIINRDELPSEGSTFEFVGKLYGISEVSFIWVEMSPGDSVRLHQHPYGEIFIVQEGQVTFTVGTSEGLTELEAQADQIVIVPPNTPHKFANRGKALLRQIDLHLSPQYNTEWLES